MTTSIDLHGSKAVITGAGKGIGREIALQLANAGSDIFAVSRTKEDLESLGIECSQIGVNYSSYVVELRDSNTAKQIAAEATNAIGNIDILINNAGVSHGGAAVTLTETDWDLTMNINAKGAFFLAQALGKTMLDHQYGRIINISSQAGIVALKDHMAYGSSKAALGMITKVLALEWGGQGITVNAIAPTVIRTPMGERGWSDPQLANEMRKAIPVGRFGEPAEVASLVTFLASKQASLINGAIIPVDGGYTAR